MEFFSVIPYACSECSSPKVVCGCADCGAYLCDDCFFEHRCDDDSDDGSDE